MSVVKFFLRWFCRKNFKQRNSLGQISMPARPLLLISQGPHKGDSERSPGANQRAHGDTMGFSLARSLPCQSMPFLENLCRYNSGVIPACRRRLR